MAYGVDGFWIGLITAHRKWTWVDETSLNYANWAAGESLSDGDNLKGLISSGSGLWKSRNESEKLPYICEVPPVMHSPSHPCLTGTLVGRGRDCFAFGYDPRIWLEARNECKRRGGSLASIHDSFTNDLLLRQLNSSRFNRFWLGAYNTRGSWQWSDSSVFNYTNWSQPSTRMICNCTNALDIDQNGMWEKFDFYSNWLHPYICKIRGPAVPWQKSTSTSGTDATSTTLVTVSGGRPAETSNSTRLPTSTTVIPGETSKSPTHLSTSAFVVVIGASIGGFLVVTLAVLVFAYRHRMAKSNRLKVAQNRYDVWVSNCGRETLQRYVLSMSVLCISKKAIGSGAFAAVYKAKLRIKNLPGLGNGAELNNVAVKIPHEASSENYRGETLREIDIMYAVDKNSHVLRLIGHAFDKECPMLVLEYCSNGDLLRFLRRELRHHKQALISVNEALQVGSYMNTKLSLADLISLCWQVADGMTYLSSKGYIHRDLAARNILLKADGTAKIADFGLCRHSSDPVYLSHRDDIKLPVKWTAPEALAHRRFSEQSDVWSYGILLYEIFSAGGVPYEDIYPTDLLRYLNEGHRMEQPVLSPSDV